ncbi:MAG TPA: (deoxy)nucleoside triphosphate pyrophosphohydrolase [Terriglobia bacterium]|jgi:8-oxo-dGTP diphosphatase|nr:(deoxy)nucleoside triphosphate pyrophosphohydrolase [Terriglobia bacterium]
MASPDPIAVAAGILVRDGDILICQRHHTDSYGLQWEFPGGKMRPGETPEQGLRRELEEELAVDASVGPEVFRLRHRYPDRYVQVIFFRVDSFRGEVKNRVFESVVWAPRSTLGSYDFLEADRELVRRISSGEIV